MRNLIIIGDRNARAGCERERKILREHGVGERNDKDRWVEFCTKHNLEVLLSIYIFDSIYLIFEAIKNHEKLFH